MIKIIIDGSKKHFEISGNSTKLKAELLTFSQLIDSDTDIEALFELLPIIREIVKNNGEPFTKDEFETSSKKLDEMMSDYLSSLK